MCFQIVERYAVCKCICSLHLVDACPAYGRRGHGVSVKNVLVGNSCAKHSALSWEQTSALARTTDEETWFTSGLPVELTKDGPMGKLGVTPAEQQKTYQFSKFAKFKIKSDVNDIKQAIAEDPKDLETLAKLGSREQDPAEVTEPKAEPATLPMSLSFQHWLKSDVEVLANSDHTKLKGIDGDSAKDEGEHSIVRISDLQVHGLTKPSNPTSSKDYNELHKERIPVLELANNKADEKLRGQDKDECLDKDKSPFVQYYELKKRSSTDNTVEPTPLHPDSLLEPTLRSFRRVMVKLLSVFKATEQPVDQGKTRIQWQCHCGYRSFDDFVELSPGATKEYQQLLYRAQSNPERAPESRSYNTVSRFLGGFTKAVSKALRGHDEDRSLPLPRHQPVDARQHQLQAPANPVHQQIFLLLCIPHRQYATKLLQLDLQNIQSDQLLFKLLRAGYQDIRGRLKSSLSLKTVRSIKFVQFEMYRSELVDVRKANDMPPEDRRDEYMYQPMPANLIPPVGENYMLHLYSHPEDADDSAGICLSRIPKKLRERLRACPVQGTSLGWGIHITEGWHFNRVWLLAFVILLLASLAFLICWAVLQHDLQGACGVAAYILAFATLAVGSVQAAFESDL